MEQKISKIRQQNRDTTMLLIAPTAIYVFFANEVFF